MDEAVVVADEMSEVAEKPKNSGFDIRAIVGSPAFIPGLFLLVGLFACFWPLLVRLPKLWLDDGGYYSHGFLVPLISAYIVSKNWSKIRAIPVKTGWFALPFLVLLLVPIRQFLPLTFLDSIPVVGPASQYFGLVMAANAQNVTQVSSVCFIVTLLLGAWFVAGFRWMMALAAPIMFLAFMLPLFTGAIDNYTNPLQIMSTKVAFEMLKMGGLEPVPDGNTIIYLNNFNLDVGVPCSGLKLVLAVTAFTAFFMLIANLRFWGNMIMAISILPLCLFINGLRIALIGVVGNSYGREAGHAFHDWSGYIGLLVCFFLLFKLARLLGWKE